MAPMRALIEEPPLYGNTLPMWEQYLERVQQLPDDDPTKRGMVVRAREVVAQKRAEDLPQTKPATAE